MNLGSNTVWNRHLGTIMSLFFVRRSYVSAWWMTASNSWRLYTISFCNKRHKDWQISAAILRIEYALHCLWWQALPLPRPNSIYISTIRFCERISSSDDIASHRNFFHWPKWGGLKVTQSQAEWEFEQKELELFLLFKSHSIWGG